MGKMKIFAWILAVLIIVAYLAVFVFITWDRNFATISENGKGRDIIKDGSLSARNELSFDNYIINGNDVYWNDEKIYIVATPHTLTRSDYVYINVTSKIYTGNADITFGVDTEKFKPTHFEYYNPQTVQQVNSYSCNQPNTFFNYTASHFWCYLNYTAQGNGTGLALIYDRDFQWGNIPAKTAYWNTSRIDYWHDVNRQINSIYYDYGGMNKWYYIKDFPVNANQEYAIRVKLELAQKGLGYENIDSKYWFAIKPSSETIQQAIANEHLYALDPFINSTGQVELASIEKKVYAAWQFDETTGSARDVYRGIFNCSMIGTPNQGNDTALMGKSLYIQGGNTGNRCEFISDNGDIAKNWSLNMWVYWVNQGAGVVQFLFTHKESNLDGRITTSDGSLTYVHTAPDVQFNSNYSATANNWIMVTYTCEDGARASLYLNGTLTGIATGANICPWNLVENVSFGSRKISTYYNLAGNIDNVMLFNASLNASEVNDLWNSRSIYNATVGAGAVSTAVTVNLTKPINYFNSSSTNVTFNCSMNGTSGGLNLTLIVDAADVFTAYNDSEDQNLSLETSRILSEGNHNWTCRGEILTNRTTAALRYFNVDTGYPNVTAIQNLSATIISRNSTLWFNATDAALTNCWYSTNENLTNKSITCNTKFVIAWQTGGTKTIVGCANDSFSRINCTTGQLDVFNYTYAQSGASTTGEGNTVYYSLLISMDDIGTRFLYTNATLIFNNTAYAPTPTYDNNHFTFTQPIFIPDGYGSVGGRGISWNWTYNIANATTTIASNVQTINSVTTVYAVAIDNCSAYTIKILNLSLRDEETTAWADDNITLEIDVNLSKGNQSWSFYGSYNQTNVSICVPAELINNTNYTIDFIVGYNYQNHVREFYYLEDGTLSNDLDYFNSQTDKNINLYDLLTADSTTFLFEYTDENSQEVDDIIVHTFRKYIGAGIFSEVERSKEDNSGQTHVHLVEEDVIYYFMITQGGNVLFTSDTYNAKCLATPCLISLSASATEFNWSIIDNEGGHYSITSNSTTRIVTVTFNLNESALVNATVFRFNGTTTAINSTSLTGAVGTLRMHIPIAYDNSTFFVVVWKNNELIKSQWVSLAEDARTYFGTFGAFLAALVVMALVLMAVTEGVALVILTCLAVFISGALMLVKISWVAMIALICAGGIIVWKLVKRRNIRG